VAIADPSAGDPATATWADSVADALNAMVPSWTNFSLASGFGANSFGYAASYFLDTWTGRVWLRGTILKSSGNFAAGTTTLVTAIPAGIRPAQNVELACATNNSTVTAERIEVTSAGVLAAVIGTSPTITWVGLDGLCYSLT
jgi:hypothetical protein